MLLKLNRLATDQRIVAERKWRDGLRPKAPQLPCDVGLFGDDHLQLDLVEMLQYTTDE
jgi:hypothetical protein